MELPLETQLIIARQLLRSLLTISAVRQHRNLRAGLVHAITQIDRALQDGTLPDLREG